MSLPNGRLVFGSEEANKIAKQDKERERILAESGTRIKELRAEIAVQDDEVSELRWELESAESRLKDMENELRELEKLQ